MARGRWQAATLAVDLLSKPALAKQAATTQGNSQREHHVDVDDLIVGQLLHLALAHCRSFKPDICWLRAWLIPVATSPTRSSLV